jgi:HSP20 family protein
MLRSGVPGVHWQPLVDVLASEDLARIRVEVAGVPEKELNVVVSGRFVRVFGQRPLPEPAEAAGLGYHAAEILYGWFERSVELPWEADPERVRTAYENGLLLVRLSRKGEHGREL